MSIVHLQNVEILNANAAFEDPYIFKITFECISQLEDDLEWKLIYVGSAQSKDYDQELDNCMVGPVPVGVNSFEFEGAAPSPDKIPAQDLLGVTVILLTASYKDAEFIRVGYYVHNFYEDEALRENPPETPDLKKVRREVLVSKPRVTRFNIKWDSDTVAGEATSGAEGSASGTTEAGTAASSSSKADGATAAAGKDEESTKDGAAAAASKEKEDDIWPAPTEQDFKDAKNQQPAPPTAFAPVSVS